MQSIKYLFAVSLLLNSAFLHAYNFHSERPKAAKPEDFHYNAKPPADKVVLGKFLFYDKILSGNKNISCATCHHALSGTGDGLSLPVGEGGRGLGITRDTGTGTDEITERVPRNSPHIFNLGAQEVSRLFHDGRLEADPTHPSGFRSPAGDDLPLGLENILAAQAMFPVTSATEMAGHAGENPQADFAAAGDLPGLWRFIANKVSAIPEYVDYFKAAYPDVMSPEDIEFVHIANALAAYEIAIGTKINSPFDRFLRGDRSALSFEQIRGMWVFYGEAGCGSCHGGTFQTDHDFRAIAVPQIGPGKGDGDYGYEDFGRERVTGNPVDRYKFRTPSLRNLAVTAPYGHSGAFGTLRAMVEHHFDTVNSLYRFDSSQVRLPENYTLADHDFHATNDPELMHNLAEANELRPIRISKRKLNYLLAFLQALNDPEIFDMRETVPSRVPSGLPIFE